MKPPIRRTPEDALRLAIDALGGPQDVGYLLKPEHNPILSGQWISHCLSLGHRSKLSVAQIALIFRRAFEAGQHDGFTEFAEQLGYRVVGIEPQAELEELSRKARAHAEQAISLSQEVLERMHHANLKVEP